MLSTDNEQVAGVMNDLRWDGTCATLTGKDQCTKAGSHSKQVHADVEKQADFMARVLVLSLSDVDVIPDGPVYCCNFQGEAEPGSCCSVGLVNVGASDPSGKSLRASGGSPAQICTAGSSNQPGRGGLGSGSGGPLSASNDPAPMPGGGGGQQAPAAQAPSGGGGAPVAQVLQGGGARPGEPAGVAVVPPTEAVAVAQPTPPAAAPPTLGAVAAPTAMAPPLAPPTAAVTSAPTEAPTAAPTAANSPEVRATKPPTPAAAASKAPAGPKQAAPAAKAEDSSWFGCQIGVAGGGGPLLGLGILVLLGVMAWRGRR